jgi:uncharacterized RDD family membrane protein YckC
MSTGFETIGKDQQLQDHWLRRLVAFVIDTIIVSLIAGVLIVIPLYLWTLTTGLPWYVFNPFSFPFFTGIISVLYFSFLEAYYGWTFGKHLMNLRTVKLDGQKPSLDLAFLRNLSKIYWILALLDTVIALATPGDPHQKLTDRVAGTTVVSEASSPFPPISAAKQ